MKSYKFKINGKEYAVDINGIEGKNADVTVNGVAYISTITFDVDPMSSNVVRFYKLDVSEDYTYPHNNDPSVITFNAI